jgi:hypothetical protein
LYIYYNEIGIQLSAKTDLVYFTYINAAEGMIIMNNKKTIRYFIISFSSFGLLMYIIALTSYIHKNYYQIFEKYQSVFIIVSLGDFFLTIVIKTMRSL